MTIIIGINYGDGIVMASDLLEISLSGAREEKRKLHYKDDIAVGYAGTIFFEDLRHSIQKLLSTFSIDELVKRELARFSNELIIESQRRIAPIAAFEVQPPQLDAVIGYSDGGIFQLLYDDGSGAPLKHRGNVEVLYPLDEDISDFTSAAKHSSRQQALDLAISFIRDKNRRYPDEFSGLEVIELTANVTRQLLHEGSLQ